jgi:hypothetical protein
MVVKMRIKTTGILILWGLLIFSSCDEQMPMEEAQSDPITNPQFVFMRESNLLYFSALYEMEFEGEFITTAMVEWSGQGGTVQDTIWLNDQGNSGDIISDDGLYSSQIINDSEYLLNTLDSSNVGSVSCTFIGIYGNKKSENKYFNFPPEIISLTMPDSIVRPSGEEIEWLLIVAEVIDENGLEDLSICGFTSLHMGPDTLLNHGKPIWLYDDGGNVEIFSGYYSGDEIIGDGKFTIQIPIFGPENPINQTKTGEFLWTFIARDNSNEPSEPMDHTVVVE